MAVLLTVCKIFLHIEVENRHFRPLYCGPPQQANAQQYHRHLYIAEKHI